ncbi:MAG: hypothetical protein HUK07_06845, partial [Bacteroidaceae bacterium]|nr:hypothetical protein [Bacteroidaceae bacterium]
MQNIKLYTQMDAGEQDKWLADFRLWLAGDLRRLDRGDADVKEVAEKGVRLIASWRYCRSFCEQSFMFKDYARRIKTVRLYAERITKDLQQMYARTIDLTDPALLVPHRGRPTKEEAAAKALIRQREAEEKRKEINLFNQDGTTPEEEQTAADTP